VNGADRFKRISLDDFVTQPLCLLGSKRIQFDAVARDIRRVRDCGERYAIPDARVDCRTSSIRKAKELPDPYRLGKWQREKTQLRFPIPMHKSPRFCAGSSSSFVVSELKRDKVSPDALFFLGLPD
jgi:hypothetical protein